MADTQFRDREAFQEEGPYHLMPLRFGRISGGRVLVTNQTGEFAILERKTFDDLVGKTLPVGSPQYLDLKSKGFLSHGPGPAELRVVASQLRTKKAFLEGGPKLHIFVPTLRCNQSCGYCQASRAGVQERGVDMTKETASAAIDLMLAVKSPHVTMEFQGGEPLLAFDMVSWMVDTAAERASASDKIINFVICTNLTLLEEDHLAFFKRYNVSVSTSVDGPAEVHDQNRPLNGAAAYSVVIANIHRCEKALGPGSVSALMTTTLRTLSKAREVIDEYVTLGQRSIFLRELNPYGYAAKTGKALGYHVEDFVSFYRESLMYILHLNRNGTFLAEGYTTTLLRKILTPFGVGFVDLQSPTGEGFGVVLYNHDGGVYVSDEARMLAEMGDRAFRLGLVSDGYRELFFGEAMQCIAAAGVAEALPGCSDCVYVPYCGADPVRHYRTQGDLVGHRPSSSFCKKQKAIFGILFDLLADADDETLDILLSWLHPSRVDLPRPSWQC